ncbi:cAMP-responsive element-binding protein-like 2 isoform X1 [Lethenteron reissneri]|uniref:cAMP-responsive element-binding protein-like 2 isoform X1 n=1 Tax=Lethenteron reissneri TaxID=7753 RepID=UPI002AB60F3D|nr:cAMP-responsive element-binding protein-like 2 isoform X1 [Lethenteron reissneri]
MDDSKALGGVGGVGGGGVGGVGGGGGGGGGGGVLGGGGGGDGKVKKIQHIEQVKKPGKRGRKPAKIDLKAKLERSRQSARECRARKKQRYQCLEEMVSGRERAICALREELDMYKQWCIAMDQGKIPSEIKALLSGEETPRGLASSLSKERPGKH